MKTLTLIRHTRPDIQPGICYGHKDIDVAHDFFGQAAVVSEWLISPDLIITSPLLRAKRLAEYLAAMHGCELRSHAGVMEMNFGDWEGRDWGDIERSEIDAWNADVMNFTPPNGESAQQMMQRVQDFLRDLTMLPQQHIVIVAHGGSIRALLAQRASIPLSHTLGWQIDYGSVIVTT